MDPTPLKNTFLISSSLPTMWVGHVASPDSVSPNFTPGPERNPNNNFESPDVEVENCRDLKPFHAF